MKYVVNICLKCGGCYEFHKREINRMWKCPHCGREVRLIVPRQEAEACNQNQPVRLELPPVELPQTARRRFNARVSFFDVGRRRTFDFIFEVMECWTDSILRAASGNAFFGPYSNEERQAISQRPKEKFREHFRGRKKCERAFEILLEDFFLSTEATERDFARDFLPLLPNAAEEVFNRTLALAERIGYSAVAPNRRPMDDRLERYVGLLSAFDHHQVIMLVLRHLPPSQGSGTLDLYATILAGLGYSGLKRFIHEIEVQNPGGYENLKPSIPRVLLAGIRKALWEPGVTEKFEALVSQQRSSLESALGPGTTEELRKLVGIKRDGV